MERRLVLVGLVCWLALALPIPAWGAPDYDGDGFIADDCAPLDAIAHPGATDVPDVALEDLDCDGVDGTVAGAFFVSTAGSDAGVGSLAGPFRTIGFAVAQAAAAVPKRDVYVQAGAYEERVVLAGGVSVFGGYGPGGSRALAPATTIRAPAGQAEAVLADGATGVELQLLEIQGPNTPPGASSYALRAIGGASLALIAVKATGGGAGAGGAGSTGSAGTPGNGGRCGGYTMGVCEEPNFNHTGGSGGSGAAGGGAAGGGGASGVLNSNGATGTGGTGGGGGAGGQPTNGDCSADPAQVIYCGGRDGGAGGAGADGVRGAGATFGIAGAGATWANPAAATTGGTGAPGSSGGGGGSGYSSSAACFSGAGGGGGGSGTGGTSGGGGSNGGGSFAVYLAGSSVVVDGGLLTGGSGGNGGKGGDGGLGGAMQPANNPACFNGGGGGKGGKGGRGGGGGGGAGGPSAGVFATSSANFAVHDNASVAGGPAGGGGAPGAGGSGGAAAGGAGASAGTLAQAGSNGAPQDFDGDGTT